jgi:hypothetical protein
MISITKFTRSPIPGRSHESVRSSIVNCICPECGAALGLGSLSFSCQGRCGRDWLPVWDKMRTEAKSARRVLGRIAAA